MNHYEIQLTPSQRNLHIFVGEYDKKMVLQICGQDLDIDPRWQGAYITTEISGNIEPIMWIKNKKSNPTFLHEVVHCVTDLMKCTGINDDEFRAWYTEWLFNTVIDAVKLSKEKNK